MTKRSKRMITELDPKAHPVFERFLTALDESLGDGRYIVFEGRRSVRVQEPISRKGGSRLMR